MYTNQGKPYKLEAVAGRALANETNDGEVRGAKQLVHEHEHDTYIYTNQEEPYKLEAVAGGASVNETNYGEVRGAKQLAVNDT